MPDFRSLAIDKFGNDFHISDNGRTVNYRYNCPFCVSKRNKEDNDYKLYFDINKGKFFCFKCHSRGNFNISDISNEFIYNDLVELYSDKIEDESDEFNMFYINNIKIENNTVAYNYLKSRGITEDKINYYGIRLGINELFGRIIVPNIVFNKVWTDMYSARSYIDQNPKYKNPEDSNKDMVFNLHRIEEGGICYVVEGVITAICAGKEACATYGCSPSEEQINLIVDKNFKEIYCVYDNDESGRIGQEKLSEMLNDRINCGTNLFTVEMPNNVDAADMGEENFKKYVRNNRVQYVSEVYNKLLNLKEI